ncbi:MAG: ribosome maturation factor RimP [Provencibacterium sp.]|jgi:ribosome maturation factor RimP|nr:ribosome maturation factor RimP [Provencibacterium sp.]
MAGERKSSAAASVLKIAEPVAERMGLEIWDVRYEKEGASWYLRIFIDKPGGVNINDCEQFSRAVDPLIDEADPIDGSYYFEVSSPGIERELCRPEHFLRYIGQKVTVRLIRPLEGRRDYLGTLESFADGVATLRLETGENISFERRQAAHVRVYEPF